MDHLMDDHLNGPLRGPGPWTAPMDRVHGGVHGPPLIFETKLYLSVYS